MSSLKTAISTFLKRFPSLDGLVWRLRHPCRELLLKPCFDEIKALRAENLKLETKVIQLAGEIYLQRIRSKAKSGGKVKVSFVCHEPALWPSFASIYDAVASNPGFVAEVIAMPNINSKPRKNGMLEFAKLKALKVVSGYDESRDEWLDPENEKLDFVFLQVPYPYYSEKWRADNLSSLAILCYIPYATCVFRGEVDDILHPESYFKHVRYVFLENEITRKMFLKRFEKAPWLPNSNIIVSGSPKLDQGVLLIDKPKPLVSARRTILWTPRWRLEEGVCTFFEYRHFMENYPASLSNVSVVFRPHPLMLNNFVSKGLMTQKELDDLRAKYESSDGLRLDLSPDYQTAMAEADILVTDTSSMMWEFMFLNRPIVYTHKTNVFNELGERLAEGFYWVRNESELRMAIDSLLAGNDPLSKTREQLVNELLGVSTNSGEVVARYLADAIS